MGAAAPAKALAPVMELAHGPGNRIGVSTYSFWRFAGDREDYPIASCIEQAADMGFDGVEILHVQMGSEENAHLQMLKRKAIESGLDPDGVFDPSGICIAGCREAPGKCGQDKASDRYSLRAGDSHHAYKYRTLGYERIIQCIDGQPGH